jgi:hypothetical protein
MRHKFDNTNIVNAGVVKVTIRTTPIFCLCLFAAPQATFGSQPHQGLQDPH